MLTRRRGALDLDERELVAEAGHHLDDPSRDPEAHLSATSVGRSPAGHQALHGAAPPRRRPPRPAA